MRKFGIEDFKIHFTQEKTKVYVRGNAVIAELYGWVDVPSFGGEFPYAVDMEPFGVRAKGVALLMEGDKFDESVGRSIALAKAENKAYEYALRKIMTRVEELLRFNDAAFRFKDKVDSVIEHNNNKYIKEIGK